ncbi:MAG: N-acetylmuramoyl-L-alanine amidase [Bacteroidetes bacterium]|nr:N-acetylmuramoyl-L-alanine amidase [Bacteroidota bacterium]
MRIFSIILFTFLFTNKYSAQINGDSLFYVYSKKLSKSLDKKNRLDSLVYISSKGIGIVDTNKRQKLIVQWQDLDKWKIALKTISYDTIGTYIKDSVRLSAIINSTPLINVNQNLSKNTLEGVKIAIDPGHFAGNSRTAAIEEKYLTLPPYSDTLIEGELTLLTAQLIKEKLERFGANVLLTRTKPDQTAFGITFDEWYNKKRKTDVTNAFANKEITAEEKDLLLGTTSKKIAFRKFFLNYELKERARKINAFKPDLTLIIHYNVDEKNLNWRTPSEKNYNMFFVPGSFMPEELDNIETKLNLIRLLITDDLDKSVAFSGSIAQKMEQKTKIPLAKDTDAEYLSKYCLESNTAGVFHRNLTLTRLIQGTVCYGETMYQDNATEFKLLIESKNRTPESRVKQIANAYVDGILEYLQVK